MDQAEHSELSHNPAGPGRAHSDDLPPWLAPGASPVPPGRLSNPYVAWGSTLAATAVMVAFGLWLSEVPEPPQVAAAAPAPAVPLAAPPPNVPPMVLVAPASAGPVAPRPAVAVKKPPVVKRRVASARPVRIQARTSAPAFGERNRLASIDSGEGQRMRCKHGELARECLARYRQN